MRILRIGRRLAICIEPRDIWIGVRVAPDRIYICPLPLLVVRWSRRGACEWERHHECTGCSWCSCHVTAHTCTPFDPPELRRAECQRCRDEDTTEYEAAPAATETAPAHEGTTS